MQSTWKSAYIEGRILSATPLELVNLLYEQAILCVDTARDCLQRGDHSGRGVATMKAVAIVTELDSSLNHDVGGEVSQNLARLYQYMRERLISANLRHEDKGLAEVRSLLATVGEAWSALQGSNNSLRDSSPESPERHAEAGRGAGSIFAPVEDGRAYAGWVG